MTLSRAWGYAFRCGPRLVAIAAAAGLTVPLAAQQPQTGSVAAIPVAERDLPTIVADRPVVVPGVSTALEGPVYLPNGDLLFSDVRGGRVLRLDREGRITTAATLPGLQPAGLAIGPDGRLYVAATSAPGRGSIVSITMDGRDQRTLVPEAAAFSPNDLVFDARGGFYFTDARGSIGETSGGVWYVAPGGKPTPVVQRLAVANGVALAPDGKRLWVGEFALGRLYRVDLEGATRAAPFGATTAYHFVGPAPDSMRTDLQGRVYVALNRQGRILIFSPLGIPVGQIVLPGRDVGRNLGVTSLAIRSDTGEIAIVTSDGEPGGRSTVFRAHVPRS